MRQGGVILHISSLPSPCGIGTMGRQAREFADFLQAAGLQFWQILPLGEVNDSNSPYQSPSVFAGNPLLIDLEQLRDDGLLRQAELEEFGWGGDPRRVDFAAVKAGRAQLLRRAWQRAGAALADRLAAFRAENACWLPDYARYMTLEHPPAGLAPALLAGAKARDPAALEQFDRAAAAEQGFWVFQQYLFHTQWQSLRQYVNSRGVGIIGDIPIYVAARSADVWAHPELFCLTPQGSPAQLAGCPPDYFAPQGQVWGNPLYDWQEMQRQDWRWWAQRLAQCSRLYDKVRLDHFRGFEAYFCIPAGPQPDARAGRWQPGPGRAFFDAMERQVQGLDLIAEDLGTLTPEVHRLRQAVGCPGMAVLQFAFDGDPHNAYLPHNLTRDRIMYTGTHDNDTLAGWYAALPDWQRAYCGYYMRPGVQRPWWDVLGTAWGTVCDLAMAQMQDLLGLGSDCRMNTPSVPEGNWRWRLLPGECSTALAKDIRDLNRLYGRGV